MAYWKGYIDLGTALEGTREALQDGEKVGRLSSLSTACEPIGAPLATPHGKFIYSVFKIPHIDQDEHQRIPRLFPWRALGQQSYMP